jgi:hypothetical protein
MIQFQRIVFQAELSTFKQNFKIFNNLKDYFRKPTLVYSKQINFQKFYQFFSKLADSSKFVDFQAKILTFVWKKVAASD